MKPICLLTIVVALTGSGYELNHYRGQFSLSQHRGFDRIRATDFFLKGIPGHPELPVKYLHYIIPPNMKADSVRITRMEITQIPGSYYIYPAQPDVPLCSLPRWVEPDSIIYNSKSPYQPSRLK